MPLTQLEAKNAKPRAKAYKLADGRGLHLLVAPSGGRYWRLNYRFNGKQKTLALGVYPSVSLAEARRKSVEARDALAEGRDPGHERKIEKLTKGMASGDTFRAIAGELIVKMELEGRAQVTINKTKWLFDFAYPFMGDRPIADITAAEILAVLQIHRSPRAL